MKKVSLTLAAILAGTLAVQAEFKMNPDANTLWSEDGKAITGWRAGLKIAALPDGGFTVEPDGSKKCNSGRYVPISPEYPWFVCEISGFTKLGSYKQFNFSPYLNMIANPQPGLFVFKFGEGKKKQQFLAVYNYGLRTEIKSMKLVKVPPAAVEYEKKDGKINFTVTLAKPAEDAALRFFDSYMMIPQKLGGQDKLQLKPVDENNPVVWTGSVAAPEKKLKGMLLAKVTLLGSEEVKVPVWTAVKYVWTAVK